MQTVDIEAITASARSAYSDEINAHGRTSTGAQSCRCGWEPKATTRRSERSRSIGLHISAAVRRASKTYDAESARLIAEARR